MKDDELYYQQFKTKLIDSQPWPGPYLYKFIVKQESDHLALIKSWFDLCVVEATEKQSSKGSYRSLSILAPQQTPEQVIAIYKQVKKLKGVIIL